MTNPREQGNLSLVAPRKKKAPSQSPINLFWTGFAVGAFSVLLLMVVILVIPQAMKTAGLTGDNSEYRANLQKSDQKANPGKKPILYLIIDDVGHNLNQLDPWLKFPGPMTMAVLPFQSHSFETAQKIQSAGKEVILHMPMEALSGQDPGPGAIMGSDSPEVASKKLFTALAQIPQALGVNNHMGSKVTENSAIMGVVLRDLYQKGLFFIDSVTTPHSAVSPKAKELGIRIGERNVFLDNDKTREALLGAIEDSKRTARKTGHAVMIGHVWTTELAEALTQMYPGLLEEGYDFEGISRLIYGEEDDPSGD